MGRQSFNWMELLISKGSIHVTVFFQNLSFSWHSNLNNMRWKGLGCMGVKGEKQVECKDWMWLEKQWEKENTAQKHWGEFVQGSFFACSVAPVGPLSGVTQACRTVLSWHRFSRPITVIITLEQWLMSRKLHCFVVTYMNLGRTGSYRSF